MSVAKFPTTLAGEAWPTIKRPVWNTRITSHVSGREVRQQFYSVPIWEFELPYEVLSDSATASAVGAESLQLLQAFYLTMMSIADTFLYSDPTSNTQVGRSLGGGDGVSTTWFFLNSISTWLEPVGFVEPVGVNVYLNGVPATGWTIVLPNQVHFATPPAPGVIITADYNYYFSCRFKDDQLDFTNFLPGMWSLDALKFRSVKP